MARFKRLADSLKYAGPVAIAGDCTKLRQRLSYSNDFGSHVLGSVLPMDECEVRDAEDINTAIDRIKNQKAMATQVRPIMVKVNYRKFLFRNMLMSYKSLDASSRPSISSCGSGPYSDKRKRDR